MKMPRGFADSLYKDLQNDGVEVIYDDRNVRPGVMFSDADLLGVPVRVIVSPRNMAENVCEVVTRDKSVSKKVPVSEVKETVEQMVRDMLKNILSPKTDFSVDNQNG